ncbi:MAG: S-layer homology domain-containing protein, partial [Ruminococcaceae bacterium]|nr:S-layer homology domain-containing protein [Oscillospiraceae bacterium]
PETGKHPFIAAQTTAYTGFGKRSNVLDTTGKIGPNSTFEEAVLTTSVMWWGEDMTGSDPILQLTTQSGAAVATAAAQHSIEHQSYPFTSTLVTKYSVNLNKTTLDEIALAMGKSVGLHLDYYKNGETLSRREALPFALVNLIGVGKVENAPAIPELLETMGMATDTNDKHTKDFGDEFVNIAMNLVAGDSYSTGDKKAFSIQLAPTSDPTKFLGFIEVNIGNMRDKDQVTGVYAPSSESGDSDLDYMPGAGEMMLLAGKRSLKSYLYDDYKNVLNGEKVRNLKMQLGGYSECLIFFNENSGNWEMMMLSGGFNLGGGVAYSKHWNTMVGPVPFTTSLELGGTLELSVDALGVAFYNATKHESGIGNDILTQLRVFIYLKFFAGVGIDYAIIAFKLGIFGQISVDMQFAWLNRPYMLNSDGDVIYNVADRMSRESREDGEVHLDGQSFKIDGQIGLEFIVRFLFFSYEKILYSFSFNLLNETTRDWETIQSSWDKNQKAQMSAISSLLGNNSLSVANVGGQRMMTLNLAPTLESRDYLENGSFWNDGSMGFFALDATSALKNLEYNSYPYANPVVTDDGAIVAYLSDMDSTEVEDTRASFAVRNDLGMYNEGDPIDNGVSYGDSQISISGSGTFAAAAWTRQMESINKDAGAVLTDEDQMIMMNSAEIYAAVYNDSAWESTRLTDNGSADLAPVVAANGSRAIVAWRAVTPSNEKNADGFADVTNFDEKDTILYRIYDGTGWSDTFTMYNGTSGAVKGITAAMMTDGTAAVAYTLDVDGDETTVTDREIYYAVVDKTNNEVVRNVRATKDAYLDENPQLTAVKFPGAGNQERFVLGWYAEQAVTSDAAVTLDGGAAAATDNETMADIRLLDFNEDGIYTQLLPDSISQAASAYDVSITPSFRFTKNADSITDLSILWVERDGGGTAEAAGIQPENSVSTEVVQNMTAEKDVLKGIKFYTYGENSELITFTGAVDVAEMGDGTLIDHFDAYVSNSAANEIKAVILGSTYGAEGTVTRIGTTVGGDTVQYTVPSRTTSMYTATETYQDKIEVPAVLADYETVRKGADTEILFTVDNNGIHAINKLVFTLSDGEETRMTTYEELNLLPGDSIQLYADYKVPGTKVVDVDYTVQATFDEDAGASGGAQTYANVRIGRQTTQQDLTQATGKVYLDLPDLEITEASIVSEEDGKRTILVKLNNASDADLTGSGRRIKIGFYSDSTCEEPITGLDPITVDDTADLTMIDEGGYSVSAVFDVKEYLEKASEGQEPITEIPEGGIQLFIEADILETVTVDGVGQEQVSPEVILSNNISSVVCENLQTRTGVDAIITSTLANTDAGSTVTVSVQNTRLSQTSSGNIIVTLLDKDGNVLGHQQSYTSTDGLLTLNGEQRTTTTFTFEGNEFKEAASAQAVYSDLILDTDNADLTNLSFSNIPGITLDSFVEETENCYRAIVSTRDLTSTAVMAVAASGAASIVLSDKTDGTNVLSENVRLIPGTVQDITITVTSGTVTKTYILTIYNNSSTSHGSIYIPVSYRITVDASENGSVTAVPTSAAYGTTVTLTVTPDVGYILETLTVTTNDGKELKLISKGNGKFTFKMPSGNVTVKATFTDNNTIPYFFADVPADAYYFDAVAWAVENGITSGTSAFTFSPETACTRAQAVTFLWRAAGSPEPESTQMPFKDVSASAYYFKAVLWAVENGITNGTSATTFSPDAECTRAQIVTFLWRSQKSPVVSAVNPFGDVKSGAYYYDAVLWAVSNGITSGTTVTAFSPTANCTRAQIVTFLYRCLNDEG